VSLRELIENSFKTLSLEAKANGIEFAAEFPLKDVVIQGEPERLFQAIINILDNAIKYSYANTRVTVTLSERGEEARIDIRDQGGGIPKEDLDRVFERFYRVDRGRARGAGGTGLGLSIVKHAVMAHKGRVWAESEPEEGAVFHIVLPKGPEL
jgi:two-component system, OmpR family, phosphate regulon sensor histidine kinase PhoR